MKVDEDTIRQKAHSFWLEAGKPEGLSVYFWRHAEDYYKRNIYENLKLPVCPKCSDTKYVQKMNVPILLVVHDSYPWFECSKCEVRWNARDGIRIKEDARHCYS